MLQDALVSIWKLKWIRRIYKNKIKTKKNQRKKIGAIKQNEKSHQNTIEI